MEKPPSMPNVPTIEMDLSEAWDFESQAELFKKKLKRLQVYRKGLLFSGFNGEHIGKKNEVGSQIFCSDESHLSESSEEHQSSLHFALVHNHPVIALYDPDKLESLAHIGDEYGYIIKDPSALIAYIRIK